MPLSGEILKIDRDVDDEWQEGKLLSTDKSGIFPTGFVGALEFGRYATYCMRARRTTRT